RSATTPRCTRFVRWRSSGCRGRRRWRAWSCEQFVVDRVFHRTAIGIERVVGDAASVDVAEGLVEALRAAGALGGVEEEQADVALARALLQRPHDLGGDAAASMRRQDHDFVDLGAMAAVRLRLVRQLTAPDDAAIIVAR